MAEEKARDPTKPEIKPVNIPLAKIHDLPGSVFAPPSPKSLEALTSSIVLRGVQEPVILRQREDGEFQIVSGNRRRKASELYRDYERTHRVPIEEFVAHQQLCSEADSVWHDAKATK